MQAHPEPESASARADRPQAEEQPPATQFLEVTVPSDSVIGLQFDTSLSSESARIASREPTPPLKLMRIAYGI